MNDDWFKEVSVGRAGPFYDDRYFGRNVLNNGIEQLREEQRRQLVAHPGEAHCDVVADPRLGRVWINGVEIGGVSDFQLDRSYGNQKITLTLYPTSVNQADVVKISSTPDPVPVSDPAPIVKAGRYEAAKAALKGNKK